MRETKIPTTMRSLMLTALVLFSICNISSVVAQSSQGYEIPLERKLTRIQNAENDLYRLPVDKMLIRNTILPEVEAKKLEIAPNYPTDAIRLGGNKAELLSNWINTYPSEYDSFVLYLEILIRSYL